jgi:hypothetical protein
MKLPTAKEINPFNDLDGQLAERCFLGKSLAEAEALFRENSIYYQEDLMFMGIVAFRFYVPALISYIRSEAATSDSDIINCFAGLLESRLEYDANELTPIASDLAAACSYVIENYDGFDVMPEIYGDLRPRFENLRQNFWQLSHPIHS